VEAGAHRLRAVRLELSPAGFRKLAIASAISLYVIVVTGALVRLTSSGLGCDSWPGCEQGSFFPEQGYHGAIEFSNRAVAILPIGLSAATAVAAWRRHDLPRWAAWLAIAVLSAAVAWGVRRLVDRRASARRLTTPRYSHQVRATETVR